MAVVLVLDPRRGHPSAGPKWAMLLGGAVVAGVLVLRSAALGARPWAGNPLRWPVVALAAWTALSAAASDHHHTALVGFQGSYDGLWTALALVVVFLATAAAFRARPPADAARALGALWLVAGSGAVSFAAAQLLDRLLSPGGWEWARPSLTPGTIGGTFGNPNTLAAFLAVLLPVGVVVAVIGGRRVRAVSAAVGALAAAELGITGSRGGLVAAVAGMGVLAVLLRGELRARRRAAIRLAAATVGVALGAAVVVGALGAAKRDLRGLVRVGPGSTADLRLQVWSTAVRVAADHPVVGVGPDAFGEVFAAYATPRFASTFGPFTVANGAHNVFLNTLADLGAGGLAAFLGVLAAATRGVARAWRSLNRDRGERERERRLLLAGVAAALVAYLVQACSNPQELSLSACFWVLLGLAVALSAATGTARPAGRA